MKISGIMSVDEVERRWQANPLDTTYPKIPWWHRQRICQCPPEAHHSWLCTGSAVYASLRPDMLHHADERSWMGSLPTIGDPRVAHERRRCANCGKEVGEVNYEAHAVACPEHVHDSDLMDWRW